MPLSCNFRSMVYSWSTLADWERGTVRPISSRMHTWILKFNFLASTINTSDSNSISLESTPRDAEIAEGAVGAECTL